MHDSTLGLVTLFFFGSELALALFRRSRHTDGAKAADLGSIRLLWIVITLAITLAVSFSGYGPGRFSFPPSVVRATALAFLGFGLSLANALSLIVLMVPIVAVFWYRMLVEEAALRQALGTAYVAFCARTKRLIPGIV